MTELEPITLIRNNKFIEVEENFVSHEKGTKNRASFQIDNLKGPVDSISLITTFFPEERHKFDVNVTEYNGQSAKVNIEFTDESHEDLINHIRSKDSALNSISHNGISDWIPTDSVSLGIIYSSSDKADSDACDFEWLDRKIHELSCVFQKSMDIPQDILEGLFHSLFPRRHTKIELLEAGVILFGALNTNARVKNKIIRQIMKKVTALVSTGALSTNKVAVDLTLNLMLNVWTLIGTIKSINSAYELLKNNDTAFKEILSAHKKHFTVYIDHLNSLITVIINVLSEKKYDLLGDRLTLFVKGVEDLMKQTEFISVKCDEHLKSLEEASAGMTGMTILHTGIALFEVWYGLSRYRRRTAWQRIADLAIFGANTYAARKAYNASQELGNSAKYQSVTLKRFQQFHVTLTKMSSAGKIALTFDHDEIGEQSDILIEEFQEFKTELCKMEKIFSDV
ncbi:11015_t:CDS:2 [Paraglomus brasilianum]|uniref:11015_t:CDS:1 n=1 Tax=Paraglomus brasilianum TaxID=144538 RepID=A0A9N9AHU3_9GLOM|nr:11015_t:CDS:2 [Paraglomus brasilianum]